MPGVVRTRYRWRERYRRAIMLSIPLGIVIGAAPTVGVAVELGLDAVTRKDVIASAVLAVIAAAVLWIGIELTARLHLGRAWRFSE
jgi:hypothetical protein